MSDVTDDDLTRWERMCHETYRTGAEREYRDLGAEAMRYTPRLIAEIRRLRAEPQLNVTRTQWQPNPILDEPNSP